MKRYGDIFKKIYSFDNLLASAKNALKANRYRASEFYLELEKELLKLQKEISEGVYQPQPYKIFPIFEKKERLICSSHIRDRVVHHALCRCIHPILERRFIFDSYSGPRF